MNDCFLNLLFSFQLLLPLKEGADFVGSKQTISVNLYKEYSYLKLNELEELPCFGVTIWQPSQLLWSALYYFSSNSFPLTNLEKK